jgi:outer membrane autotransporter protein
MFSTGIEIGRKLRFGQMQLVPSIGLRYIYLGSPSVTETSAADANLYVYGGDYNSLRLPVGAKLSRDLRSRNGIVWTPEARAFYVREFCDASAQARTSFDGVRSVSFIADSGKWGRNSGRFGLGLNAKLSGRMNFRIDYDYEVYDHTTADQISTTLGVNW